MAADDEVGAREDTHECNECLISRAHVGDQDTPLSLLCARVSRLQQSQVLGNDGPDLAAPVGDRYVKRLLSKQEVASQTEDVKVV